MKTDTIKIWGASPYEATNKYENVTKFIGGVFFYRNMWPQHMYVLVQFTYL